MILNSISFECNEIYLSSNGDNITILTSENLGNLPLLLKIEAKIGRYYYLNGGR